MTGPVYGWDDGEGGGQRVVITVDEILALDESPN